MPKKKIIKHIVCLSDLHVGSTVGIWPEGFVAHEGYEVGQTPIQKWLWRCWQEMQEWVEGYVGKDGFATVINGDCVEGIHHKSLQVMTPDPGDQVKAVEAVLGQLRDRADRLYLTLGTECHTRNDEVRIGAMMGAERDPETGHAAFNNLRLHINDTRISFHHHIGTAGRPDLESAALARALVAEQMEQARNGFPIPDIIVRAHRHRPGYFDNGCSHVLITGPWQDKTRFGHRVVPGAVCNPSVGIISWEHDKPIIRRKVWKPEAPPYIHL
jgi:hypothetical protein